MIPGDLVAKKIGDKLLLAQITVKINLIIQRRIVVHYLGYDFIFGATTHDDFICSHGAILVRPVSAVELCVNSLNL